MLIELEIWTKEDFCSITTFPASGFKSRKRALEKSLVDILATNSTSGSTCEIAGTIRTKPAKASPKLLTLLNPPGEVEVTRIGCERRCGSALIQRKITNGFLSIWVVNGDCAG